jgi:hypothetical protein
MFPEKDFWGEGKGWTHYGRPSHVFDSKGYARVPPICYDCEKMAHVGKESDVQFFFCNKCHKKIEPDYKLWDYKKK